MNPTQLQAVLQDVYARIKKLEEEIALLRKEQAQ
jgi:hypothetical protein